MFKNLFWLALGAFAVGTEGFVIAGILPAMSKDLGVSLAAVGQLVTVFSLAYGIGSPLLAIATANWPRESVLRVAIGGFALANVMAAAAPSYGWLMTARVLLALTAGLFMPTAGAYAAASVEPAQRGRAIGIVYLGMTSATVIGVPIGTLLGGAWSWRVPFASVAAIAFLTLIGLFLPRARQALPPNVSLRERLAVAKRPDILLNLFVTFFWMGGIFAIYTYFAPYLHNFTVVAGSGIAGMLMLFGTAGAIGNVLGGRLADQKGAMPMIPRILGGLTLVTILIALAVYLPPVTATIALIPLTIVWGMLGWAFTPTQQSNLVHRMPQLAPVVLSLNSSAMYLGVSFGAFMSSLGVAAGHVEAVTWVGITFEVLAVGIFWFGVRDSGTNAGLVPVPPKGR